MNFGEFKTIMPASFLPLDEKDFFYHFEVLTQWFPGTTKKTAWTLEVYRLDKDGNRYGDELFNHPPKDLTYDMFEYLRHEVAVSRALEPDEFNHARWAACRAHGKAIRVLTG